MTTWVAPAWTGQCDKCGKKIADGELMHWHGGKDAPARGWFCEACNEGLGL